MKKEIASTAGKSLTPENNSLKFAESYMSVSNFYLSKKGAQKKIFDIKIKGFDLAGNSVNLGGFQFDLSKFVNKQNESVKQKLQKTKFSGSILEFNISVAKPEDMQMDTTSFPEEDDDMDISRNQSMQIAEQEDAEELA